MKCMDAAYAAVDRETCLKMMRKAEGVLRGEFGSQPATDGSGEQASQVSTPFHQKDLNQGEPVAAAATVGKTPERSERRRHRIPQLEFPDAPFFGRPSPNTGDGFAPTKSDRQRISRSS